MKQRFALAMILVLSAAFIASGQRAVDIPNPSIDMKAFLKLSRAAAKHRESRRLTEEEFIRASKEPDVIILDARSERRYNELHIRGAINLSFPDITVDSLAKLLPNKDAKILIYCNNNFLNADPFPTKAPAASLNLSTYVSLYTYGYRNVYELGPLLDVKTTRLELVSSEKTPVAGEVSTR
jgi:phage shock protein E